MEFFTLFYLNSLLENELKRDISQLEVYFSELPLGEKIQLASKIIDDYMQESDFERKYRILNALPYLSDLLPDDYLKELARKFDYIIKEQKLDMEDVKLLLVSIGVLSHLSGESKGLILDRFYQTIKNEDNSFEAMQNLIFEVEFLGIENVPQQYLPQTIKPFIMTYLNYQPPVSISYPLDEEVNPMPFIRKVIVECELSVLEIFIDFIRNSAELKSTIIKPANKERLKSLSTAISRRSDLEKSDREFLSSIISGNFGF